MTIRDDDNLFQCMRCQIFGREQIYEDPLDLDPDGLYGFVSVEPPHLTYVGRSRNLKKRIKALRRRRRVFSHVLTVDFPGLHVPLATLKELEKRMLRSAWMKWEWSRWTNRMDLWTMGDDRYLSPGSPSVMSVVEQVLADMQKFMRSQPTFQPGVPTLPEMTHALGGARDEVHATGTRTGSGFTVLTGSRLSSAFKSVAQLKAAQGPEAQIALDLLRNGILDRQYGTLTRMDGLYLMSDHEFEDPGVAASVLLGRPAPAELWRELTQAEINEMSVPHGSHRRWR